MANWLEPEEVIGGIWDRFVGDRASYSRYADAVVSYKSLSHFIPVFFRTIGGDSGVRFAASKAEQSDHRLGFLQRLGRVSEHISTGRSTNELIILPQHIDFFPTEKLNKDLYIWLAIFFATAEAATSGETNDPLLADLALIKKSHTTTVKALDTFHGFHKRYKDLSEAIIAARQPRKLSGLEENMESLIRCLIADTYPTDVVVQALWHYVKDDTALPSAIKAPLNYKPVLPMPLWGELCQSRPAEHMVADETEAGSAPMDDEEEKEELIKKARREIFDQANRDDPLILYPFEGLLSWAEMLNLARTVEDEDDENAKKIADDADEIVLSPNKKRAATKIKLSLDLPPNMVEVERLIGTNLYKEWDYQSKSYLADHCKIIAQFATEEDVPLEKTPESQRMIARVKRQFEALRPKREILHRQLDGSELDMDAVIRSYCDRQACGVGSDNIYISSRDQARDLSVAILVDSSLSSDAWIENRRVLDVEKETLSVLANGLEACGDQFALYNFTSLRRDQVFVNTLKDFDEPMSAKIDRRMAAMKPGFYTRIGAAIRYVADQLDKQEHRHRLMLVITDGKPNDIDHYEGRYGIEDTRMAIREARRMGQTVYGVTIDKQAREYFPHIFGKGSYSIVSHLNKLPAALPAIYRSVTS